MSIVLDELQKYSSDKRKKSNEWFFKTGKGEYGEGDKFIGVSNPDVRKVAKIFFDMDFANIIKTLNSEIHEERLVGILILVNKYEKATNDVFRKRIVNFYLKNINRVNNWDLVDLSAYKILGHSIFNKIYSEQILDRMAESNNMWERRVSIISTLFLISNKKFDTTIRIAKKLLNDKEDLSHKAVGWALREIWKRDPMLCEKFLIENYIHLPRTTLRYAIERMESKKRKKFLNFKKD